MKKIISINEKDLTNIIKNIIKETIDSTEYIENSNYNDNEEEEYINDLYNELKEIYDDAAEEYYNIRLDNYNDPDENEYKQHTIYPYGTKDIELDCKLEANKDAAKELIPILNSEPISTENQELLAKCKLLNEKQKSMLFNYITGEDYYKYINQ